MTTAANRRANIIEAVVLIAAMGCAGHRAAAPKAPAAASGKEQAAPAQAVAQRAPEVVETPQPAQPPRFATAPTEPDASPQFDGRDQDIGEGKLDPLGELQLHRRPPKVMLASPGGCVKLAAVLFA